MSHIVKDGSGNLKYVFSLGTGASDDPYRMVTEEFKHAAIDAGLSFFHSDLHSVANAGIFYYLIKTPASTSRIEFIGLSITATDTPIEMTFYEDAIVSANGTAESLHNMNRRSAISPTTLLYEQPTVTSVGTLLFTAVAAGDKTIGGALKEDPRIILDYSSNYLLKLENTSGATSLVSITIQIGED